MNIITSVNIMNQPSAPETPTPTDALFNFNYPHYQHHQQQQQQQQLHHSQHLISSLSHKSSLGAMAAMAGSSVRLSLDGAVNTAPDSSPEMPLRPFGDGNATSTSTLATAVPSMPVTSAVPTGLGIMYEATPMPQLIAPPVTPIEFPPRLHHPLSLQLPLASTQHQLQQLHQQQQQQQQLTQVQQSILPFSAGLHGFAVPPVMANNDAAAITAASQQLMSEPNTTLPNEYLMSLISQMAASSSSSSSSGAATVLPVELKPSGVTAVSSATAAEFPEELTLPLLQSTSMSIRRSQSSHTSLPGATDIEQQLIQLQQQQQQQERQQQQQLSVGSTSLLNDPLLAMAAMPSASAESFSQVLPLSTRHSQAHSRQSSTASVASSMNIGTPLAVDSLSQQLFFLQQNRASAIGPLSRVGDHSRSSSYQSVTSSSLMPVRPQSSSATINLTSSNCSTEKKPSVHTCPYCDKTFTRPSSLKTHQYTHTGERPHRCDYVLSINSDGTQVRCGKTFSVSSNLRRHLRSHKKHEQEYLAHAAMMAANGITVPPSAASAAAAAAAAANELSDGNGDSQVKNKLTVDIPVALVPPPLSLVSPSGSVSGSVITPVATMPPTITPTTASASQALSMLTPLAARGPARSQSLCFRSLGSTAATTAALTPLPLLPTASTTSSVCDPAVSLPEITDADIAAVVSSSFPPAPAPAPVPVPVPVPAGLTTRGSPGTLAPRTVPISLSAQQHQPSLSLTIPPAFMIGPNQSGLQQHSLITPISTTADHPLAASLISPLNAMLPFTMGLMPPTLTTATATATANGPRPGPMMAASLFAPNVGNSIKQLPALATLPLSSIPSVQKQQQQ